MTTKIGNIDLYSFVRNEGQLFFVAGDAFAPESEDDPYLFRRLFILTEVEEGGAPKNLNELIPFDGRKLTPVEPEEDAKLYAAFQQHVEMANIPDSESVH